jgi:hypothetical protein
MTNVEYVTEIMEFSRFGALAQAFVIEAVAGTQLCCCKSEDLDSPGLSGAAWTGVERKSDAKLAAKYGPREANG